MKSIKLQVLLRVLSLVVISIVVVGCSSVKKYSVESYQGLLPLEDVKYVEYDPD